MAGEKPGAPVNWFKFCFVYFFFFFYESVKVYSVVHKMVFVKLHLVMTDKTDEERSEMLRFDDASIGDIANINQKHFQYRPETFFLLD